MHIVPIAALVTLLVILSRFVGQNRTISQPKLSHERRLYAVTRAYNAKEL